MPSLAPLYFDRYTTLEALAENLRCSPETILSSRRLQLHKIPKKQNPNTFREVWEVKDPSFRDLLRTFNHEYLNFIRFHHKEFPFDCIHGFVPKRSILTNARAHIGKSFLLKLDIKNFFGSISSEDLENHFKKNNINIEIAKILSSMLTVNGRLPQGFCTSPLIANLIFLPLDQELLALSLKYNSTYTRYADDITFSSNSELPSYKEVQLIISKNGFELDKKKHILRKRGQALYVTGLSVSDHKPRVSKKWKHRLRQEIYYIQKYGLSEHVGRKNHSNIQSCINIIDGKIRFLKSVEPDLAAKMRLNFNAILSKENRNVIYNQNSVSAQNHSIYIDECIINKVLYLCLVLVEDVNLIEYSLRQLHEELQQKNFLPRIHGSLDKKTFHWTELSDCIREKTVNALRKLPFRAYISCKKFETNYKEEYKDLFSELLNSQFLNLSGHFLNIYVETTTTITEQSLQEISDRVYDKTIALNSRGPSSKPIIKMLPKNSFPLAIPDCILGIFKKYESLEKCKLKTSEYRLYESFFDTIKPKLKTVCVHTNNNKFLRFKNRNGFTTEGYELWSFLNINYPPTSLNSQNKCM